MIDEPITAWDVLETYCDHAKKGIAHIEKFQRKYKDQLKRTKVDLL